MLSQCLEMERFLFPVRPSRKQNTFTFTLLVTFRQMSFEFCILTGRRYRDHRAVLMLSGGAGDLQSKPVQGAWVQTFHDMLSRVSPRRKETHVMMTPGNRGSVL